jgi:hypothetical protein
LKFYRFVVSGGSTCTSLNTYVTHILGFMKNFGEKKLNEKTKRIFAFVSMLLIASVFASSMLVSAHSPPWVYPTWTYIAVQNNPTQVQQPVLLVFWTQQVPLTAAGMYGDRYTFFVDVTKPDGTKETLGPYTSDPVGGSWALYTPTQVGTYSVVARNPGIAKLTGIPGQEKSVYVNDTILPSTSNPTTFVAQQQAIPLYGETPLPDGYWTRPINSANRAWGHVASNWLNTEHNNDGPTTTFARGTGPESPHVLWSRPLWSGGIMDALYNDLGYDTIQYEGNLGISGTIILDGKFFYNVRANPRMGWYAVDLYTGETLYFHNTTGSYTGGGQDRYPIQGTGFDTHGAITGESLSFGQLLYVELPNQHGGYPYLWSTTVPGKSNTWRMFDAYSGNYICDIGNVSASGTRFVDDIGSICYANIVNQGTASAPNYYLTIWNTTEAIWFRTNYGSSAPRSPTWPMVESAAGAAVNTYWMWRPYPNVTFDGRNGFSFNQSITDIRGPINSIANQTGTIRAVRDDFVIVGTTGQNNEAGIVKGYMRAYSLKGPNYGKVLWDITFTPPSSAGNLSYSLSMVDPEDGVFVFNEARTLTWVGYSLTTGEQLWKGAPEVPFNYYGMGGKIYMGQLITHGYGGQIRAYDIKTGKINWMYNATNIGAESPYGGNYPQGIAAIADGKLYLTTGEHSFTQPMYRGPNLRCIDAATGKEIWKIQFRGGGMSPTTPYVWIADGILLSQNADDAQIYAFGKGPSATTVTTLQTSTTLGTKVMFTGTVTDQSPSGRQNINGGFDFKLKGTPAISDADMQAWMEYMFMQREFPANAKGVPVHLTAVDPNGNFQDIGTATSDTSGNYGIDWTPPVPGLYKVTATFAGSESYGSSFATTYFSVSPAAASPEVVVTPTPPPTLTAPPTTTSAPVQTTAPPTSPAVIPPTSAEPTTTYIAIGSAVVVIVLVAAALVLRKRK